MVALLEDDTGMELLVCNKIISLDLPVKEVYKKIWCAQPNVSDIYYTYNSVSNWINIKGGRVHQWYITLFNNIQSVL